MDKESLYELKHEYFTQQEVADLFRVTPNTVKNWRDHGLLDYFQVLGSTRVLYPIEGVNQFKEHHKKKATVIPFRKHEAIKMTEGHELSSTRIKKDWRI
jgi:hypothetical protein